VRKTLLLGYSGAPNNASDGVGYGVRSTEHFGELGLALLGALMSFFLELSGAAPHFPFLTLLAISVGLGLVLIGYEVLVRCFSR
jgi:hypothetical protein